MANKSAIKNSVSFVQRLKTGLKSDSFKAVAILAIIGLITSLTLSVVHRFTKVDQSEVLRNSISEVYKAASISSEIDINNYTNIENSVIQNAFMAEDGACIIVAKSNKAYNAAQGIALFVIIKDGIIENVANYSSSETPGLGSKVLAETYLSQYQGIKASDLAYSVEFTSPSETPKAEIRYLTGATKTSVGVKIAVEAAATFYVREVAR